MTNQFDLCGPLPESSLVLEASAGTGKTYALAALATRMIAEGTPISRILICTFSRAARRELQHRIRSRLGETARDLANSPVETPADPVSRLLASGSAKEVAERQTNLAQALADFDSAWITTLHAFAHRELQILGTAAAQLPQRWQLPSDPNRTRQVADDAYLEMFCRTTEAPPLKLSLARDIATQVVDSPALIAPATTDEGAARTAFAQEARRRANLRPDEPKNHDEVLALLLESLDSPAAREVVADQFDYVMIDEFQDTDKLQWQIITKAFLDASTAILIGDPKQAIYGFRGADVNCYLEATRTLPRQTLATNYRSDPPTVSAVSMLFGDTPLGASEIRLTPVNTPEKARSRLFDDSGTCAPGMVLRRLMNPPKKQWQANTIIRRDVALQIQRLTDWCFEGQKPVSYGDIAILVRSNYSAAKMLEYLTSLGIPAATAGTTSVVHTDQAHEWQLLLDAIASRQPTDINAAALTDLLGFNLPDVLAPSGGTAQTAIADLATSWAEGGFPAVFDALFGASSDLCVSRLLAEPGGERVWTNLRQIGQILLDASWESATPTDLSEHLRSLRDSAPEEPLFSRRLDSDSSAVHISTYHGAKGLEYPIVLLPEAYQQPAAPNPRTSVRYRDGQNLVIDVSGERGESLKRAKAESLGDTLRTLYVGFTRAQSLTIAWDHPEGLLNTLHSQPGDALKIEQFEDAQPEPTPPPISERPQLAAEQFQVGIDSLWRRTSYSALTRGDGPHGDEPPVADPDDRAALSGGDISAFDDIGGGVRFGTLVHEIFELADFTDLTTLPQITSECLIRSGISDIEPDRLTTALTAAINHVSASGLSLSNYAPADFAAELEFDLPLAGYGEPSATLRELADVLAAHPDDSGLLGEYPDHLRSASFSDQTLAGFLTGSIDAVLPSADGYLVVDYKTNRLPTQSDCVIRVTDYGRAACASAMMAAHYPLQALLYSVGLHRYLAWRLPDYDPETHLRGCAYLFVRGMTGAGDYGVFEWRWPAEAVSAASDVCGGRRGVK